MNFIKEKVFSVFLLVCVVLLSSLTSINSFAEAIALNSDNIITPQYTTILLCYNNLKLESGGKFNCEGRTTTQKEYTAGIKMELQQSPDTWKTIKTWDMTSSDDKAYLNKDWYVVKGSYRLKLTHTGIDNGNVVETVIKYSNTVTY